MVDGSGRCSQTLQKRKRKESDIESKDGCGRIGYIKGGLEKKRGREICPVYDY